MQSFHLEGIVMYLRTRVYDKSLAIPHFFVDRIGRISAEKLWDYGFRAEIFDNDNTLTLPRCEEISDSVKASFERHRRVFGDKILIVSNYAGTRDDAGYGVAKRVEQKTGVNVLRHDVKKPKGQEDAIDFLGVEPDKIAVFGDRIFTDVVYGNEYGMLTVHTCPLTEREGLFARMLRQHETKLVQRWRLNGIRPKPHKRYYPGIYCLDELSCPLFY